MLERVHAGGDQPGQRLLAEYVRRDPGPELVRASDGGGQHVVRPQRGQITHVAVDPVTDDLDPAVAEAGLLLDGGDQAVRLDLDADVAQVTLGPGHVPAGADQPGQVRAPLHEPVVHRGAGVPDEQRAGVPVGGRLLDHLGLAGHAVGLHADVAVAVDQAGHDPARRPPSARRHRLVRQPAVDDPQVPLLAVGQHGSPDVQAHGRHSRACRPAGSPVRPGAVRTCPGTAGRCPSSQVGQSGCWWIESGGDAPRIGAELGNGLGQGLVKVVFIAARIVACGQNRGLATVCVKSRFL